MPLAVFSGYCAGWSTTLLVTLCLLLAPARTAWAQLSFGGPPEGVVEEVVEERVEEAVEESVQEQAEQIAEDSALESIEERIEERLSFGGPPEEAIEEAIEERIEEAVQEAVSDNVEVILEGNLEDDIEQDVEDTIESIVEESVEESLEENIEVAVESSIEQSVEENIEVAVEQSVEESVEASVEQTVEESVAQSVEENVEASLEETVEEELAASVEQDLEAGVEETLERDVEGEIAAAVEERLEDEIDEILERIEIDEGRIHKGQWLVMAEPEVFDQLADEGYLFDTVTDLPGMGLRLAEVAAPSSFDISEIRQGVIDVVGSDRAEVDLNHIYAAGDEIDTAPGEGLAPRSAISFPADVDQMPLRIGMIDSLVDVRHPALNGSQIQTRSFAPQGAVLPDFHGTAIASIIVASGGDFVGLAPMAQVYAAAVFEQDPERGEIASTVSLVRALDWLISSGVDVVNISLAGPPNRLLEAALERASARNVMILAAAGNGGPAAQPMYPAAYGSVVAVTAVDAQGQVFRLANRGAYLDLAAPGVGMMHAKSGGGYTSSSGTSFAVPFAATALARLRQLQPTGDVLEELYQSAQDLGPPGRDDIYGYGLLRPAAS